MTSTANLTPKERADVYQHQFDGARLSFDQRRSYQLKIGLAMWTALLAFIAILIKGDAVSLGPLPIWLLVILGMAALIPHLVFLRYSQRANKVDQRKAECYETLLNREAGVSKEDWQPVDTAIAKTQKGCGRGWWIELLHMFITVILVLVAIVLLAIGPQKSPAQKAGGSPNKVNAADAKSSAAD